MRLEDTQGMMRRGIEKAQADAAAASSSSGAPQQFPLSARADPSGVSNPCAASPHQPPAPPTGQALFAPPGDGSSSAAAAAAAAPGESSAEAAATVRAMQDASTQIDERFTVWGMTMEQVADKLLAGVKRAAETGVDVTVIIFKKAIHIAAAQALNFLEEIKHPKMTMLGGVAVLPLATSKSPPKASCMIQVRFSRMRP